MKRVQASSSIHIADEQRVHGAQSSLKMAYYLLIL